MLLIVSSDFFGF